MTENEIISNPFRLISTRAIDTSLSCKGVVLNNDYILDFKHKILSIEDPKTDEEKRIFIVEFDAKVSNTPKTVLLSTKFQVIFKSQNEVTKEYLDSPGIKINSPAIAFPFLRGFVSTVSVNAGYPPIILPSINFVRLTAQPSAAGKTTESNSR
jgi:preprotein translocase subunit SecB